MNRTPRLSRRVLVLLTVTWLAGLALRTGSALALDGPALDVSESGQTALRLVRGDGYTFDFYGYRQTSPLRSFMPPLYPAVIAVCRLLDPAHAGQCLNLLQAVLSSFTPLVVFAIGVELFDSTVALLSAAGVAFYPVFLVVVAQPTATVVNTLLLSVLVLLLVRLLRSPTLHPAWLAGLTLGLSALDRPLILVSLAPLAGWLWLRRRELRSSWWQLSLAMGFAAGLCVAPWVIRNLVVHRAPVFISTNGGFTFWNGNNSFTTGSGFDVYAGRARAYLDQGSPGEPPASGERAIVIVEPYPLPPEVRDHLGTLSEVELDRALYLAGLQFIRQDPLRWLHLLAAKLRALWWFRPNIGTYRDFYEAAWITPYKALYSAVLLTAAAGAWLARRDWRRLGILYVVLATLTAGYVSFNVITRYRWEMEPFLLMLASVPVARVAATLPYGRGPSCGAVSR